jgi:dTDP-4-amino-4,6-dideoxygalactose transaminase
LEPIPFLSLGPQHAAIRTEILTAISNVYDRNWFVLGNELEAFEKEFARFSNTSFCIGTGNGLDALFIALKACGIGVNDEVIVPAHTFLATWLAVIKTGAKVIPVEPDPSTYNIDVKKLGAAITKNTKAIVPVHLYGQPCEMPFIVQLGRQHGISVIEDNAQAHGATWGGQVTGSFGNCSATSFYPVKNLGALGDGGAIVTHDRDLARYARQFRNYGFETKNVAELQGINSRLDEMQATCLRIKLRYIQGWNDERIKIAETYNTNLAAIGDLTLPNASPEAHHVYHLFVVRTSKRDELRQYLAAHQVETSIHYPSRRTCKKGLKISVLKQVIFR